MESCSWILYPKPDYCKFSILIDIIKALEARDFRVPNIEIRFGLTGYGIDKFKYVSTIEYNDIRVFFCSRQGSVPGYEGKLNDIANISELHIKGHTYRCFSDSPGNEHKHYYYIGSAWEQDKNEFRHMQYGSTPIRKFEKYLSEEAKLIFMAELQTLLEYINMFPETSSRAFTNSLCETEDDFKRLNFKDYPSHYPTLYVLYRPCRTNETVEHFKKGHNRNKREMIADIGGERLVSWNANKTKIAIDPIACDGFGWAFVGEDKLAQTLKNHENWKYDDQLIFEIRPHYLDDIYVADLSIAQEYRRKCFESSEMLTDEQYNMYITLRGTKVVTLKEYMEKSMVFTSPQYLIRKDIGFDEIRRIYHIKRNKPMEIIDAC